MTVVNSALFSPIGRKVLYLPNSALFSNHSALFSLIGSFDVYGFHTTNVYAASNNFLPCNVASALAHVTMPSIKKTLVFLDSAEETIVILWHILLEHLLYVTICRYLITAVYVRLPSAAKVRKKRRQCFDRAPCL